MMSDLHNEELKVRYEKISPDNCEHGYGGWCATCRYAIEPIDTDLTPDGPTYCRLSLRRKESK